ncbi:quinone oxidoreductase [Inquilinus sp.]|uniref:quinone oxidoreductase family protein n=1 Tax=Inquilinus sp. TaxID=1932117 RepID=UPI0031D744B6
MATAIRIHEYGPPEVLQIEPVEVGDPGPGGVRLRQTAIGLNFVEVYFRRGDFRLPELPATLGNEGVGVVEAIGPGVAGLRIGDRVAYADGPIGAYATERLYPADRLVPLPDGIPDAVAAAVMLKGMTAQYLLKQVWPLAAGDTVLFHAAAGGVGQIFSRWARHLGIAVIGTASTPVKRDAARRAGCAHVLDPRDDLPAAVRDLTGGHGVAAAFDSIGRDTALRSLDCLRPRGILVSFGLASGPAPAIAPLTLAAKGSLYLTHCTLPAYTADRAALLATAGDLFAAIGTGVVTVDPPRRYPLADIVQAHRDLEGRRTTGRAILLPG